MSWLKKAILVALASISPGVVPSGPKNDIALPLRFFIPCIHKCLSHDYVAQADGELPNPV